MENLPPFYVGQKVVRTGPTVETKSGRRVTKGSVYTVAFCYCCASCSSWKVGILELPCATPTQKATCHCGCKKGNISHYVGSAKFFAPLLENFESVSLSKILEVETKLIGVN